jgi:DNA-binding GntR family transcriptional regulator
MAVLGEKLVGADSDEQVSIYAHVNERLAVGEFAPGARLKADALRQDYGVSASTMRELLFRLACGGFVDFEEQRGFSVPPASMERLLEVRHLRTVIETEGARLAIERGDMEWEARLNAAHHKLAHIEFKMREAGRLRENIAIWTRFDWEFHETLVSAAGSELLTETLHGLFLKYRQRLVAFVPDYGFRRGTVDEHGAILEAALARDAERCAAAIRTHYAFLDEIVRAVSNRAGNAG